MSRGFSLGAIVATFGAQAIPRDEVGAALARHAAGDWGDVCEDDRQANETALQNGTRLLSVYRARAGTRFWVITEADRSVTTVLLPEEY